MIRELGLPEEMLRERYVEVWNKVDLVSGAEAEKELQQRVEWAAEQDSYQVVLTSCT